MNRIPKLILGIESSCDETAAAIVSAGRIVHSSVIDSQIALHRPHGGVVPEIASRRHVEVIGEVVREAVRQSGFGWDDIEGVAATRGPGLASSLLVGWSAAKGLALRLGVPLCAVNHVVGHIHSVFLDPSAPSRDETFPFLALAVSGGHTALYRCDGPGRTRLLARTVDDAAGEALDKASKLLGLGYPGGPVIDRLARGVQPKVNHFPATHLRPEAVEGSGLDPALCFSFSGLKTALRSYLAKNPVRNEEDIREVAASYQTAIVDALCSRLAQALRRRRYRALAVGGGVSLNAALRARLAEVAAAARTPLYLPPPKFCGDNGAMIASLAGTGVGVTGEETLLLDATPDLRIGERPL